MIFGRLLEHWPAANSGSRASGSSRGEATDPDRRDRVRRGGRAPPPRSSGGARSSSAVLEGPAALPGEGEVGLQLAAIGDRPGAPGIEHHLIEHRGGGFGQEGLAERGRMGREGATEGEIGATGLLDEDDPRSDELRHQAVHAGQLLQGGHAARSERLPVAEGRKRSLGQLGEATGAEAIALVDEAGLDEASFLQVQDSACGRSGWPGRSARRSRAGPGPGIRRARRGWRASARRPSPGSARRRRAAAADDASPRSDLLLLVCPVAHVAPGWIGIGGEVLAKGRGARAPLLPSFQAGRRSAAAS